MPKFILRTALVAAALSCACASSTDEVPALFVSESGFRVTRGELPEAPGCGPLSAQWEQTAYALDDAAPLGGELLAIADRVTACLEGLDAAGPDAMCLWPRQAWALERDCTSVLVVPGGESCTDPDHFVLDDDARGSCAMWGKPYSPCACRWTVATQDAGRTIVLPERAPATQATEAFVRISTGCLYPWLDPGLARCAAGGT